MIRPAPLSVKSPKRNRLNPGNFPTSCATIVSIMASKKSRPVAPKPSPADEHPGRTVAGGGAGGAVVGALVGGLIGTALGAGAAYTPDEPAPKLGAKKAVAKTKKAVSTAKTAAKKTATAVKKKTAPAKRAVKKTVAKAKKKVAAKTKRTR